jgi:hypothetical protein
VRFGDQATRGNAFHQHVCAMLARAWYTSAESNSLTAPDHYKSSQLSDPIGALPGVALRRFDLIPSLVAKDDDKAARGLLLPARGCFDLSESRSLGALNQRDDLPFLLARSALGLLSGFLARSAFFSRLAF